MWGTGASSTQCEGAAPASDWWEWERSGHAPLSGDGNGFSTRYAEDFALLAGLGLTHHRLSLEWARLEPEPGVHDPESVRHYRDVPHRGPGGRHLPLGEPPPLHPAPVVPGRRRVHGGGEPHRGLAPARGVRGRDVRRSGGRLAAGQRDQLLCAGRYGGRGWPPGHDDREETALVNEAIHLATAEAAMLLGQTGVPVSSIYGLSPIVAQDDDRATPPMVRALYDDHWAPWIGLLRDGVLKVPGRNPVDRPDLVGFVGMVGFSYYAAMGVRAGGRLSIPRTRRSHRWAMGSGPTAWASSSTACTKRCPGLRSSSPSTASVPTTTPSGPPTWNAASTRWPAPSGGGSTCVGLFHWTAVDNYEWLHGFDVSFGIIDRDRNVRPERARPPAGGPWVSRLAGAHGPAG